jgi:hypothetical protein
VAASAVARRRTDRKPQKPKHAAMRRNIGAASRRRKRDEIEDAKLRTRRRRKIEARKLQMKLELLSNVGDGRDQAAA